ncbi:MAG TPA: bifunctional 4-hydroxy-2-oxoglutarate aldolase/2-dehydro-3-deoxy-phosphogluconate aldolase [Acidothermaceae bacterium]
MAGSVNAVPSAPTAAITQLLARERLLPVVVLDDAAQALALGAAVRAGGLSSMEVTLRTTDAEAAIRALAREGDVVVGAGTVLTRAQAERAIDAGATFVVSPGLSSAVISYCLEIGVPVFPGVATATEIMTALELGCRTLKFFPADVNGGTTAIKALAAPFADVRFVPTGGIGPQVLAEYLSNPAVLAVGGSWMVARALVASSNWAGITELVATAAAIVADAHA